MTVEARRRFRFRRPVALRPVMMRAGLAVALLALALVAMKAKAETHSLAMPAAAASGA